MLGKSGIEKKSQQSHDLYFVLTNGNYINNQVHIRQRFLDTNCLYFISISIGSECIYTQLGWSYA